MAVRLDRIAKDVQAIGQMTETPGVGATRPTFSGAWGRARDYVIGELQRAGCVVGIDPAGNVHARMKEVAWEEPAWMSGSHVDTVPNGGDWDGVAGVVAPLEVIRSARDAGRIVPMELVVWAEEEGPTFGLGMLGSRAYVGELQAGHLDRLKNAAGESYLIAGARFGVKPAGLVGKRLVPENVVGLIEVHIEQGPGMWKRDERLAVVTGIAGRRQYKCTVDGVANHAGSTSMEDRKDALAGAATLVLQLEGLARGLGEGTVMTVGRIECRPNAINVVPERVEFTIDFRSADNAVLAEGDKRIRELVAQVAERRGLKTLIERTEDAAAVGMDPRVVDALRRSAGGIGFGDLPTATSGALHDAAVLAAHVPTAMLFVPSRDGISHNPGEFSRAEDVMLAARVLEETVRTTVVE